MPLCSLTSLKWNYHASGVFLWTHAYCQTCQLESDLQNPHGGSEELTNCPLTSIRALWHSHAYISVHVYACKDKKIRKIIISLKRQSEWCLREQLGLKRPLMCVKCHSPLANHCQLLVTTVLLDICSRAARAPIHPKTCSKPACDRFSCNSQKAETMQMPSVSISVCIYEVYLSDGIALYTHRRTAILVTTWHRGVLIKKLERG